MLVKLINAIIKFCNQYLSRLQSNFESLKGGVKKGRTSLQNIIVVFPRHLEVGEHLPVKLKENIR